MEIDYGIKRQLNRWADYIAFVILAESFLVLLGWQFDISWLLHPLPKLAVMNPFTAICFALYAVSYFLKSRSEINSSSERIAHVLSGVIIVISAARYADWRFGTHFNIDILLYSERISLETASEIYRRMSPPAALALIVAAISLFTFKVETQKHRMPSQYMALAIAATGFISFLLYIYDVNTFLGSLKYVPMALHTAICLMLVALNILFSTAGKGIMRGVSTPFAGSIMARRLIPFVVVLPILFGLARLYIVHRDTDLDEVLLTFSVVIVISSLLVFLSFTTRILNNRDAEKAIAEQALSKLNMELEQKVKERTEKLMKTFKDMYDYRHALDESSIVAITDRRGIITYANDNFCRISKYSREELIGQDHGLVNSGFHTNEFIDNLWATIGNGKIWRGEIQSKAKDGSIYWVDTTIVPFIDEKGKPYQYVAIRSDITARKKTEEEIFEMSSELRHLLEHVQKSREEERKYIAREIHDELGQRLTALKIDLSMMQKKTSAGKDSANNTLTEEFASALKDLDGTIQSVKKIATDLRPEILDHLDIVEAVKWQAQQFENITGIPCKVFHSKEDFHLPPDETIAVYRIVQESLTNITRHAGATIVSIGLETHEGKLVVEVNDNGRGIENNELGTKKSFGIIGMRERMKLLNGSFSISSLPGQGTTIVAEIPYNTLNHS